jgi:hypothetical protein
LVLRVCYDRSDNKLSREHHMGDSKRRKDTLGENYGQEAKIAPWFPLTKTQTDQFMQITTTGAWVGIGLMVAGWITLRFIGPFFGWWQLPNG